MDARFPTLSPQTWPHELVAGELDSFYGDPRGSGGVNPSWESNSITHVVPPWQMTEDGEPVHGIAIHKKCAVSLFNILRAVWDYVGHDQAKIDAAHLNEWGGSFNYRENVNAPSKLSLHAYGAAIDIAPNENPNGKAWSDDGKMLPRWLIDAFLAEGWSWGGDFNGTKDPMHFQATFNAHSDAPSADIGGVTTPQPTPTSTIPTATVAPTAAAGTADQILADLRLYLLGKLNMNADLEAFKTSVVTDLNALSAKVKAFDLAVGVAPPVPPIIPSNWPVSLPGPSPFSPLPPISNLLVNTNITATVFGGASDHNTSAYDGHIITDAELGVALPFRFKGVRPRVIVTGTSGKSVTCDIVDVGPWNINDPYWQTASRPQAESGTDMTGRHTNHAGIDLTPAVAKAIGIDGKGIVSWGFDTSGGNQMATSTQTQVTVPVQSALASKINWTQVVSLAATVLTIFSGGKLNLTSDQQVAIIGFVGTIAPIATILFRTFGTQTITPQSLPK